MSNSNLLPDQHTGFSEGKSGGLVFPSLKNFPQFIVIHTVEGFGVFNKAKTDVFLELSHFFNHPADVGNLISGSSAFSKTRLNIWYFTVHVLLKPGLENLEHCFISVWDKCNCEVVWAFFWIAFLWDWNENWPFQSCGHCLVFPICWHIECSTFTASSFRMWNSSTGIPSPPLALLLVMLSKAHLTSHSRMSGCRWVITPSWLSGSWRSFLCSSSVYSCHLFLISSASVRSTPFSVLYRTHLCMKYSLVISNFIEKISNLSHSVVFLYFFALIAEEGFLISPGYSLELCIQIGISFLFSFAFCFSSFHSYL